MPQNDEPGSEGSSEDRFRKIREELEGMQLPDLPDEEELRKRLPLTDESRSGTRFPDAPEVTIRKHNPTLNTGEDKDNIKSLGMGITVAYTLVGAIGLGCVVGWAAGHTTGLAIGAVAGAFIGIGFSVFLLNKG